MFCQLLNFELPSEYKNGHGYFIHADKLLKWKYGGGGAGNLLQLEIYLYCKHKICCLEYLTCFM